MSSEPINPYEAHEIRTWELDEPIRFDGYLTGADYKIALCNTAPRSGWRRVLAVIHPPLFSLILFASWWFAPNERSGILLIGAAFMAQLPWLWLLAKANPFAWAAARKAKAVGKNRIRYWGWMNDSHFVMESEHTYLLANWDAFTAVYLFKSHLLLPFRLTPLKRLVLRWQDFESAAGVRDVCEFLKNRNGALIKEPPKERELSELFAANDPPSPSSMADRDIGWSKDRWPIQPDSELQANEEQFEFKVDLSKRTNSTPWSRAFRLLLPLLTPTVIMLPTLLAILLWLVVQLRRYDDWSFLQESPMDSLVFLGLAAAFLLFMLYHFYSNLRQAHPPSYFATVILRPSGSYFELAGMQNWVRWSSVEQLVDEPTRAGWINQETKDEAVVAEAMFDSPDDFQRFRAALRRCASKELKSP